MRRAPSPVRARTAGNELVACRSLRDLEVVGVCRSLGGLLHAAAHRRSGPESGKSIGFDLNDAGRVALGGSMGPSIGQIEGRLVPERHERVSSSRSPRFTSCRGGEQVWRGESRSHQVRVTCHRSTSAGFRSALGRLGGGRSRSRCGHRYSVARRVSADPGSPSGAVPATQRTRNDARGPDGRLAHQPRGSIHMRRIFQLSTLCLAAGVVSACKPEEVVTHRPVPDGGRPVHQRRPGHRRLRSAWTSGSSTSSRTATSSASRSANNPQASGGVTASAAIQYKAAQGWFAPLPHLPRRHAADDRVDGAEGFDRHPRGGAQLHVPAVG